MKITFSSARIILNINDITNVRLDKKNGRIRGNPKCLFDWNCPLTIYFIRHNYLTYISVKKSMSWQWILISFVFKGFKRISFDITYDFNFGIHKFKISLEKTSLSWENTKYTRFSRYKVLWIMSIWQFVLFRYFPEQQII